MDAKLFDRRRWRQNHLRAHHSGVTYLFDECCDRLLDRLSPIQRDFSRIALCGDIGHRASSALRARYPQARIVTAAYGQSPHRDAVTPAAVPCCYDEAALPFKPRAFDLAVSLNSLHWIDDVPAAVRGWRDVLRADGLFHAVCLGGRSISELAQCLGNAELELRHSAAMRFAPLMDLRTAGHVLQAAGLALCVADREIIQVAYRDFATLLRELRLMGEGNALIKRAAYLPRDVLSRAEQLYWQHFSSQGALRVTFEALFLHGWAPDPSQQQPLARGQSDISLTSIFDARKP